MTYKSNFGRFTLSPFGHRIFFLSMNPLWPTYFQTDLARVAAYLDLPLTWPNPDPVSQ